MTTKPSKLIVIPPVKETIQAQAMKKKLRVAAYCRVSTDDEELGLTSSNFYWTTEEDAILRTYYPKEGKLVSRRFPNRSQSSCISRAQKLGLYIIKSMDDHAPPISGSNGHGQSTNEARPDGVCSRETAAAEVDENQQEGGILPPSEMTLM